MYKSIIDFSLLRAFFSSSYMPRSVPPAILIPTHTKHTADLQVTLLHAAKCKYMQTRTRKRTQDLWGPATAEECNKRLSQEKSYSFRAPSRPLHPHMH